MATKPPKSGGLGRRSRSTPGRSLQTKANTPPRWTIDPQQWRPILARGWQALRPLRQPQAWGSVLVVVATMGWLRWSVVDSYSVSLPTMAPTLEPGDRLLVDKWTYHWRELQRGEVIAFSAPQTGLLSGGVLVNRAIGLPGDRVEIRGGQVLVNNRPVEMNAGSGAEAIATTLSDVAPVRVPAETYFVMGDNRAAPPYWFPYGYVPRQSVLGRIWGRFWPLDRWKMPLPQPIGSSQPTSSPLPPP